MKDKEAQLNYNTMNIHKQERTSREKDLENIVESMYSPKSEGRLSQTTYQDLKDCDHCFGTGKHGKEDCTVCGGTGKVPAKTPADPNVKHTTTPLGRKPVKEADYVPPHQEPVNRVGDEASGDPRTYQVGQILRSEQTSSGLDGMIVDIAEEDGELTFALMEIGEAGWTVRASEIKPGGRPRTNF
jgi:hypothetical protein